MDKTIMDSTVRQPESTSNSSDATLLEGSIASSPLLSPSTLFRGWTLLEQLPTRGSEADIYLVQAEGTQSILKLYRHRMEPKLEVLSRIAEISRRYSHCFVIFKDAGFDEQTGRWFELQEYFPLGSLKEVAPGIKHAPSFVRSLVAELSDAIHCLHCNEIVHCDIKPGNVLIRSLEPLDAVLTDFGISSLLASDLSRKMTSLKGTPMYWAPEAFSRMVGRASDWWGLGMIVLELLAGAHPFEGLTDSQIIHKLTLGDVEIPNTLEADFRLLLRGLLTKDDTQRWGRPQVSRWLAGDRDIPVAAAAPAAEVPLIAKPSVSALPFAFEGREYATPAALAQAFCENEKAWYAATSYLRYVRQWFESQMRFDEALEIGNWLGSMDSERALFRFIHTYARCPFSYMGKLIDPDNLRLFVGRTVRLEAAQAEGEIVAMLGDGRLLALYTEYELLTGSTADPFLLRILEVMNNTPTESQWVYFDAMENPKNYIWPREFCPESTDRLTTLETLADLSALPFNSADLSELKALYVLPDELTALLDDIDTYAEGAAALRSLQDQGLLIPLSADSPEKSYAALSFEAYQDRANAICKGRTPGLLSTLARLIDNLDALPPSADPLTSTALTQSQLYFKKLQDRSIDGLDALNISRLTELFGVRRALTRELPLMLLISGTVGALLLWLITTLRAAEVYPVLRVLFVGGIFIASIYFAFRSNFLWLADAFRDSQPSRYRERRPEIIFFVLLFVGALNLFNGLLANFPIGLTLAMGAAIGALSYTTLWFYFLRQNYSKIAEACAESIREF